MNGHVIINNKVVSPRLGLDSRRCNRDVDSTRCCGKVEPGVVLILLLVAGAYALLGKRIIGVPTSRYVKLLVAVGRLQLLQRDIRIPPYPASF